jgi:CRP-like cAMP-binding protein
VALSVTDRVERAVSLLDADPEFAVGIPEADHELARRTVTAPEIALEAGPWQPRSADHYGDRAFALLVVEGMLTREVLLADRSAAQLLGPGDVLSPWTASEGLVPAVVAWTVNAPSRLAVLDERVLLAARRWPSMSRTVHERLAAQATRLAVHTAIAQLPRVDARVLAALWHLAERFGRVTPAGVVLPLRLTHEAIGRLVGAQRPTVTLALRDLIDSGALERRDDGGWLLREGSQVDLVPELEPLSVCPAAIAAVLPASGDGDEPARDHQDARRVADVAALSHRVDRLRRRLAETRRLDSRRARPSLGG